MDRTETTEQLCVQLLLRNKSDSQTFFQVSKQRQKVTDELLPLVHLVLCHYTAHRQHWLTASTYSRIHVGHVISTVLSKTCQPNITQTYLTVWTLPKWYYPECGSSVWLRHFNIRSSSCDCWGQSSGFPQKDDCLVFCIRIVFAGAVGLNYRELQRNDE